MRLGAGGGRHSGQPHGSSEQPDERGEQLLRNLQILLVQHDGRAGSDHGFSIAALVLVGCSGKRHQQRGFACRGQLGHS